MERETMTSPAVGMALALRHGLKVATVYPSILRSDARVYRSVGFQLASPDASRVGEAGRRRAEAALWRAAKAQGLATCMQDAGATATLNTSEVIRPVKILGPARRAPSQERSKLALSFLEDAPDHGPGFRDWGINE